MAGNFQNSLIGLGFPEGWVLRRKTRKAHSQISAPMAYSQQHLLSLEGVRTLSHWRRQVTLVHAIAPPFDHSHT